VAAFFEGGPIPLLGITPQVLSNVVGSGATQINQNQIGTLIGQTFQGSGRSFSAGPGQTVLSRAGANILNVGLSSTLGQQITGASGLSLTSGQPYLASNITPSITSVLSTAINDSIAVALNTGGPFGTTLSSLQPGATSFLLNNLSAGDSISNGGGVGTNRRYPGASEDDPPANYGGNAYTLGPVGGDVVFSLQPANQGPQLQGLDALANSKTRTILGNLNYTGVPPSYAGVTYDADNYAKISKMGSLLPSNGADYSSYWSNPTVADSFKNATFGVQQTSGWSFICAPSDISWDLANASSRVDIFGTNNPPIVAGTKGMRDLSIGDALVEGFSRNVEIEDKVKALEALMEYSANTSDGFVSVPVYQFWANQKVYGSTSTDPGYFIIKDIKVKEEMRDLSGNATRARVDISLAQVPAYQVNSGRDQASKVTTGAKSSLISSNAANNAAGTKATQGAPVKGNQTGQGVAANKSGAAVPKNTAAATGAKPAPVKGSFSPFKFTPPPRD
jgi:hypothetical protein